MRRHSAPHSATRSGSRSSPGSLCGLLAAGQGKATEKVGDAVDDDAIDHRRAGRDADEGKACKASLADLMGDADDLIVAHADRLGQLAENVARRRTGTTQHIHVEVDAHRLRTAIGIAERSTETIDAEL